MTLLEWIAKRKKAETRKEYLQTKTKLEIKIAKLEGQLKAYSEAGKTNWGIEGDLSAARTGERIK